MNIGAGPGKQSRSKLPKLLRDTKGKISVEQAVKSFGTPPREALKTLAVWTKQGWLSRVRRWLLSARDPYYFEGRAAKGLGGRTAA